MTASLPSSPKRIHPFLSVGPSGGRRASNNFRVKFLQPKCLHWVSLSVCHVDKLETVQVAKDADTSVNRSVGSSVESLGLPCSTKES